MTLDIENDEWASCFPYEVLTSDGQQARGEDVFLLDGINAYCVAPDVHKPESCFHRQESEAAQVAVRKLEKQGLPAVLPALVREREEDGEFVWRCPRWEGHPCTPDTCEHACDDEPGFVAMVQPGGVWEMVCVNAECGEAAQEALIDWAARKRRRERERRQDALDGLRQVSVERTLLASTEEMLDLSASPLLKELEGILVPEWDKLTMFHVVLGWQADKRAQIARESGVTDSSIKEVPRVFRDRYGLLTDKPTRKTILEVFKALRKEVVLAEGNLRQWVSLLVLVRAWRDEVETIEQIAEATQRITSISPR